MHLPHKIGIIGLGLIGGSIAKTLKKNVGQKIQIASVKRECADLEMAIHEKVVDKVFSTWEELIAWSDLIILASPLSTLSHYTKEIAERCPKEKKLLVIDVSSVKKAVISSFETHTTQNLEFLSTHPMAGREQWGFAHSDSSLFQDCCWILSPHAKNTKAGFDLVSQLIVTLGGRPMVLSPQKHDEQVALISHLPALLSRLLLEFVEKTNPEALQLAGPGFRSMTRLARDNPQLHREIAAFNCEELAKQLAHLIEYISREKKP